MSLVGDVIMGIRELATDLPSALGIPVIGTVATSAGSGFTAATYFLVATQLNQFGESLGSAEASITLGSTSNISVPISCSIAATSIRIYFGTVTGAESTYQQFSISGGSGTLILNNTGVVAQPLPTRSTAYLPDSDGAAVGAFAMYRWLNEGLRSAAGYANGGIPDFGGVGTVNAQPIYNLPGYWKKLDSAWYDGYPLYMARKNDVFRKGPVPGTVGGILVFQASDRLIVETWPQPGRTSGQTTLAAPMGISDTTATLTSAAGFVLGFGLVQIGTEIMEYSGITSNTLIGLTRGLSGTIPAAQANGAAVTELNLLIAGYRVPSTYAVGSATATLNLPPAWEDALKDYMLARFREAEQDGKEAVRLQKQFETKMKAIPTNRIIAGPRQIAANAGRGAEVYPGLGGTFGGVIVR